MAKGVSLHRARKHLDSRAPRTPFPKTVIGIVASLSLRCLVMGLFIANCATPSLAAQPNEAAIEVRAPLPGLAEGFIPQGLTVLNDDILLAGYMWPLPGPQACRIYRLDRTGAPIAVRDIPAICSHAGGLASASGRLFLADTKRLIELDPARLFGSSDPVVSIRPLAKPLVGSFLAGRDGEIWIGDYLTKGEASIRRIRLVDLDRSEAAKPLGLEATSASLVIPLKTQGAAFAPDGSLWLSQSGQTFGQMTRHDGTSGALLARFAAPSGIEDIGFDANGKLWASSETGTRRWEKAKTPFPFVYRLDPKRLAP